jgi:carbamoyl-phosphate synthase large subunit
MSPGPHRVLVTSCGSGISQEIYHSLSTRRDVELFGIDCRDDTPGKVLYGPGFYPGAPPLADVKRFLEHVKHFCRLRKISYVFPGTDNDINVLKQAEGFLGVKVITSPIETCEIARSKKRTYEKLRGVVRVPEMFHLEEVREYPVFLKPEIGAGSVGCRRIDTVGELVAGYDRERDLICECLTDPREYTVDAFTDSTGKLLFHCPRERSITRAGISIVSTTVTTSNLLEQVRSMADKINGAIEFVGAWFFQVKYARDMSLCLLEIAPRVGGGSAHSRIFSGVNLPLLSLNVAIGLPVSIRPGLGLKDDGAVPEKTIKLYKTYMDPPLDFDHLYVDLDDTIILRGLVNPRAMACLYKFAGKGVPIHLITRNPGNLSRLLARFHIPESIFASITQVFDTSPKSIHMLPCSVLVDDSHRERTECCSTEKNIRCFDVDAFDYL